MDLQLLRPGPRFRPGDAHLGHGEAVRPGLAAQDPGRHPAGGVALRPDHHVVVGGGFHQLVQRGPEGPGDRAQLIEADPPVAGLDPAQGGRAQVTARGQIIQGPAQRHPQPPDPLADQAVELAVLRHTQDVMSMAQGSRRLAAWKATSTAIITRTTPPPRPTRTWPSSWTSTPRSRAPTWPK